MRDVEMVEMTTAEMIETEGGLPILLACRVAWFVLGYAAAAG